MSIEAMPYHPDHHPVGPLRVTAAALVVALLLVVYLWSFRAGRERTQEGPPPAIPSADGALPAPTAPTAAPTAAPLTSPAAPTP